MRIEYLGKGDDQAPISVEEFVEVANERFDPFDAESIWSMREPLVRLAANQEWIFSAMAARLRERTNSPWAREQPSYFALHFEETFALRANIWLPERSTDDSAILENAAFSYDFPHDHNFDILTATCFGPGYTTETYEYDLLPDEVSVGSLIPVRGCGRKTLSPGTVFWYEACKDVHTQLPVKEPTITLNFLPFRKNDLAKPQFIFEHVDENSLRVTGIPLSPEGREMSAVRMLAKFASVGLDGDASLQSIVDGAANSRVSEYASDKILRLQGGYLSINEDILKEIDLNNVAFKYHEIAKLSRSKVN